MPINVTYPGLAEEVRTSSRAITACYVLSFDLFQDGDVEVFVPHKIRSSQRGLSPLINSKKPYRDFNSAWKRESLRRESRSESCSAQTLWSDPDELWAMTFSRQARASSARPCRA
jgi:hypothetical protein